MRRHIPPNAASADRPSQPARRERPPAANHPTTRDLRTLVQLLGFVRPYSHQLVAAVLALFTAAAAVLAFGQVFREVVDSGLKSGSPDALDQALLVFLGVVLVLAGSVLLRA